MKRIIKTRKGTAILEWIIIVIVVTMIATVIVPEFIEAVEIRQLKTIESYNGTDTITEFD